MRIRITCSIFTIQIQALSNSSVNFINIHSFLIALCHADFAPTVPPELESVLRLKTVEYFVTRRPWLGMCRVIMLIRWFRFLCCLLLHFLVKLILSFSRLSVSDLYGVNVRPVAPFGSASRKPHVDSALIHRCLPDEILSEVFHWKKTSSRLCHLWKMSMEKFI